MDKRTAREIPVLAILIVIENADSAAAIVSQLALGPLKTRVLHDPVEALDALAERQFDVVLTDLDVVTPHGGVVLSRVLRAHEEHRDVGIVLRTPHGVPPEAQSVVDAIVPVDASTLDLRSKLFDVAMLSRERRRQQRHSERR